MGFTVRFIKTAQLMIVVMVLPSLLLQIHREYYSIYHLIKFNRKL